LQRWHPSYGRYGFGGSVGRIGSGERPDRPIDTAATTLTRDAAVAPSSRRARRSMPPVVPPVVIRARSRRFSRHTGIRRPRRIRP
jgi:hypothetical protein